MDNLLNLDDVQFDDGEPDPLGPGELVSDGLKGRPTAAPNRPQLFDLDKIEFDDKPDPRNTIRTNLQGTAGKTADQLVEQRRLQERTGLPPSVTDHDDGTLRNHLAAQDQERLLLKRDEIAQWASRSEVHTKVAAENVDPMGFLLDNVQLLGAMALTTVGQIQEGVDTITGAINTAVYGALDAPSEALFGVSLDDRPAPGVVTGAAMLADSLLDIFGIEPVAQDFNEFIQDPERVKEFMGVEKQYDIGVKDVFRDPTRYPAFVARVMAGSGAETVLSMFSTPLTALNTNSRLAQERAKNDGRAEATVWDLYMVLPETAAVTLLERIGGKAMRGFFDDALAGVGAKDIFNSVVKAMFKEGVTESIQEPLELLAATRGTQAGLASTDEFVLSSVGGFMGGVGMGGVIRTGTAIAESRIRAKEIQERAEILREMNRADMPMRESAPDLYADYQGGIMRDQGIEAVRLDEEGTKVLAQLVNDGGTTAFTVEEIQARIREAARGHGIEISPEQFWALPQETIDVLAEHVSLRATEYSAAEAQEIADIVKGAAGQDFQEEIRSAMEQGTIDEAITTEITNRIVEAGGALSGDPNAARAAAQQMAAAFTVMAARSGLSVDKVKARFLPRIIKARLGEEAGLLEQRAQFKDDRNPIIEEAARRRMAGEITQEEYSAIVEQEKPATVYSDEDVRSLRPATEEEMRAALKAGQQERVGKGGQFVGQSVGLRLDIPAYTNYNTWVPTMHDPKGKPIAHEAAAKITGVEFTKPGDSAERKAARVGTGETSKAPFAQINGTLQSVDPESLKAEMEAVLGDPEWTQVGYDPRRHTFFYERGTRRPVLSADEVIQVGPLIMAKNVVYGDQASFLFQSEPGMQERIDPYTYKNDDRVQNDEGKATRIGLMEYLRDYAEDAPTRKGAALGLTTKNANAEKQLKIIDEVLAAHPDAAASPEAWKQMLADAFKSQDVPIPPYRFIEEINGEGSIQNLARLSEGQIADADHGFENAREFREAYTSGKLGVETTGKLFLWSFLSRGVSPYTQESLFIDAFPGIDPWMADAAAGKFDAKAYEKWAKSVAPKGSGQPGAGATHNLNAFGRDFLVRMSKDVGDGTGRSRLQYLHDLMANPESTGQFIRREFAKFGEGVGIDNKVVSFTLLVAGFDDVMVLDRVQFRQLYNDGRYNGVNLYDGFKEDGDAVTGSGMAKQGDGVRGILIYEAIEKAIAANIDRIYEGLGRKGEGSVGRYHWETWVADSQQEASHGSLAAILPDALGVKSAINEVTAKQGEYGNYAYGARYGVEGSGLGYFTYPTPSGNVYLFTVGQFVEFQKRLSKKRKADGIVPSTKFKVSEAGNRPWYYGEDVNQEALDNLAASFAEGPAGDGAGTVLVDGKEQNLSDRLAASDAEGLYFQSAEADAALTKFSDKVRTRYAGGLPHDNDRYFLNPPDAVTVPLDALRPVRRREGGVARAGVYMAASYEGENFRRVPLSLKDMGDGTYEVRDGNSTYHTALDNNWPDIRGRVISDAQFAHEEAVAENAKKEKAWAEGQKRFGGFDGIYERVDQRTAELHDILNTITNDLEYAEPLLAGPKDRPTAELKVIRKKYAKTVEDGYHRVLDIVRSSIVVDSVEGSGVLVERLADAFGAENIIDEGWNLSPVGYMDRKVLVRYPDGMVAEVQISNQPMHIAKKKKEEGGLGGHPLYKEYRELGFKEDKTDADLDRMAELERLQQELYLPEVFKDPVLGKLASAAIAEMTSSGRPDIVNVGKSLENKLSEMGLPLSTTSNRDTLSQPPSLDTMAYASFSPTSSAGLPSQSTNITQSPSGTNIPGQQQQVQEQKARGSIDFRDMQDIVIRLYDAENLSTFLHESGHLYLEMLMILADEADATPQLKADRQAVLDWLGVDSPDQITAEHHEKWAETYEAYLREGKAPSTELQSAFDKFTSWLAWIYKSIKQIGGGRADLTPEIAEVMDRILATDQQIEDAKQAARLTPGFKDLQTALANGLTEEEYEEYAAEYEAARASAHAELVQATFLEGKRELTDWWRDELERETETILDRLDQDPAWVARAAIQHSKLPSGKDLPDNILGGVKISSEAVEGRSLPGGTQLVRKGGADPDALARDYGFDSGDAMIEALSQIPRDPDGKFYTAQEFAKVQAQTIMKERHGDLMDPATLAEEAMLKVHSIRQARVLEQELSRLAKLSDTTRKPSAKVIKAAAKQMLSGKKIGEIEAPSRFLNAERRAAVKAAEAIARGDAAAAFEHKTQQILNFHLYREARDARKDAERMTKQLSKWQRMAPTDKIHPEFFGQLKALLAPINFRGKMTDAKQQRLIAEAFTSWAEQANKNFGAVFHISSELDAAFSKENVQSMTLAELSGLFDTAKSLRFQGLRYAKAEEQQRKARIKTLATSVSANALKSSEVITDPTWWDNRSEDVRQWLASMRTMSSLASELDGGERGMVWEEVYRPIQEADNEYQARSQIAGQQMRDIFKRYTRKERALMWRKKLVPELGKSYSLNYRLSVALNMGNAGNVQAMIDSKTHSQEEMEAIARSLSSKDWEVVQALWDHVDTYWEQIAALEERTTGVRPAKVEASPVTVTTSDGKTLTLRGGYYPLVADPKSSARANKKFESANSLQSFSMDGLAKLSTKHGSTNERKGWGKDKVWLDLNVLFSHVDGVIKDVAMREAVNEVNQIIEDPDFRTAVAEAKGGSDAFPKMMSAWLENTVKGSPTPQDWVERVVNWMRTGVAMAEMGLSVRTILQQPLGALTSVAMIGEKYTAIGYGQYMAGRRKAVERVHNLSPFMRNRSATFNRDVRDAYRGFGVTGELRETTTEYAFKGIQLFDAAVVIPTWLGAYQQALDNGKDPQSAISIADDVVSRTQGTGLPRDLSNMQSGGVYKRLFTMFYSYFNAYHNLQSDFYKEARRQGSVAGWTRYAKRQLYLVAVPAIVTAYFFGDAPEDEEEAWWYYGGAVAGTALSGLIGVREVVNAAATGFGYQLSPAQNVLSQAIGAGRQLFQGDFDAAAVKSFLMALGYLGHVPGMRSASRVSDTVFDEGWNVDEADWWWRALVTGPERD